VSRRRRRGRRCGAFRLTAAKPGVPSWRRRSWRLLMPRCSQRHRPTPSPSRETVAACKLPSRSPPRARRRHLTPDRVATLRYWTACAFSSQQRAAFSSQQRAARPRRPRVQPALTGLRSSGLRDRRTCPGGTARPAPSGFPLVVRKHEALTSRKQAPSLSGCPFSRLPGSRVGTPLDCRVP
jgi:hypothetical protein